MHDSGSRVDTQAARAGLVETLRTRWVMLGMAATLCISLAVMTPGFGFAQNVGLDQLPPLRLLRRVLGHGGGYVLMLLGLVGLIIAWLRVRPALQPRLNQTWVLALWSLPMLLAPPIFSSDAFLYADQGWIIHQGLDPYKVGLGDAGGPFAANVHPVWRHTTAIYPPSALLVQYLVAEATSYQGLVSVIAMRVPAVLGVAVVAMMVPRVARLLGVDDRVASWFAVLNPLLLLHFVGGMHNDTWMVALVLVAVWCALRFGFVGSMLGAVLVGIGASFKQPGLVAFVAVALIPLATRLKPLPLGRRTWQICLRCALAGILAVGTFSAVSLVIGFEFLGWRHAANIGERTWGFSPASIIEQVTGPALNALGLYEALARAGGPESTSTLWLFSRLTTVVSLLGLVWVTWHFFFADRLPVGRRRLHSLASTAASSIDETGHETDRSWRDHPVRWLAWGFCSIAFGGAGYHVWYLLWGGVYLGMLRYSDRMLRGLVAVILVFVTVEGALEYYGVRPITGYLVGFAISWIFWTNSRGMQINPVQTRLGVRTPEVVR